MRVDLIDRLRCPTEHRDTWLVAAATQTVHRRLIVATLGCPECGAEFDVRDGEVWFGVPAPCEPLPLSDDETTRAAALLKLEEHGLYVLDSGWATFVHALQDMVDVDVLLADPPPFTHGVYTDAAEPESFAGQGTLRGIADRWPLAAAALHGIAIDRATPARAADAVRILRENGRMVAPARLAVPAGMRELARDARHWVAEKTGDVIQLVRR